MAAETQKLIEEIKEYYKVSNLSELNDEQWKEISGTFHGTWNNRLTEEFIEMFADKLDWDIINIYQTLSEKFIEKHEDRINWRLISEYQKLSEPFIEKYADKLNWSSLSHCQKMSESFIERYADRVDWFYITSKQKLSEKFIEKNLNRLKYVEWENISIFQTLSEKFIKKYTDNVNWNNISKYQKLSPRFIKEHFNRINFQALFYNKNMEKIIKFPEKYPEWADIFITAGKNGREFPKSEIKRKIQTRKFWKSYIDYLKNEYPDKTVFQIKLFDAVTDISETFNIDRTEILNVINKSMKKDTKKKNGCEIDKKV